ncbi:MAG: hypothetical protein J4G01_00935 [Dehalococcoidia bacterium]|nr:hypothetical protein [Dehalococcoidia bacterium]
MDIDRKTLRDMLQLYQGIEMSDEEFDLIEPELQSYFDIVEKMKELDLSDVPSGRLLRASEGGGSQ